MPRSFHLFSYQKAKAFCGNLRDPHFFVIDKSCQKSEWNHLHTLHPASPPRLCVRYFFCLVTLKKIHRTFLSYAWQLKNPLVTFLLFRY